MTDTFTREMSLALDQWAMSFQPRKPITVDKRLWAALADDRRKYPYRVAARPLTPEVCLECRRPMRSKHTSAKQFPGTVIHNGRGLCSNCYNKFRVEHDTLRMEEISRTDCADCGRDMVVNPAHRSKGEVIHCARGLCQTCYSRQKRARARELRGPVAPKRPPACKGCNTPLCSRMALTPGAVPHKAKGFCRPCYGRLLEPKKAPRRKPESELLHRPMPERCVRCSVRMRPTGVLKAERPDTIRHHGCGICDSCYSKTRPRKGSTSDRLSPIDRPTRCVECDHRMRPAKARLQDHPGTLEHSRKGMCVRCEARLRARAKKSTQKEAA
ncbi:hypothetical protein [Rhodococcus sp. 11-3]|uniref:hypothetical protein n=1 Tax=Rhodococcus sp. 11-3 TaxID=2854796 RepID=UPI00203DEFE4|nr:hypothetical protein [Rhodococcus sp. 11-3]USC16992.1 hypothetical protein KZJ41_09055 [Rhodococcus sp. 11-3]